MFPIESLGPKASRLNQWLSLMRAITHRCNLFRKGTCTAGSEALFGMAFTDQLAANRYDSNPSAQRLTRESYSMNAGGSLRARGCGMKPADSKISLVTLTTNCTA